MKDFSWEQHYHEGDVRVAYGGKWYSAPLLDYPSSRSRESQKELERDFVEKVKSGEYEESPECNCK